MGEEERGEVVAHDHARVARERLEQGLAATRLALDEREVHDARLPQRLGVLGHALDDEAVEAIAGVGIVEPQRLEHDERRAELLTPRERTLEGVVVRQPARSGHPVEDVASRATRGRGHGGLGADGRDRRDERHGGERLGPNRALGKGVGGPPSPRAFLLGPPDRGSARIRTRGGLARARLLADEGARLHVGLLEHRGASAWTDEAVREVAHGEHLDHCDGDPLPGHALEYRSTRAPPPPPVRRGDRAVSTRPRPLRFANAREAFVWRSLGLPSRK